MTSDLYDVVTVGESMVQITPLRPEPLLTAEHFRLEVGGAESNVALYLAELGHRVTWVSRIGEGPLGDRVRRTIAAGGVDTSLVSVDRQAPTGVYFKDPGPDGTAVHYYRRGSAASRMNAEMAPSLPIGSARLVHLSGATPGLSAGCAALVEAIIARAHASNTLISFDVNYRPGVWPVHRAAPVLKGIAGRSDIVFVGQVEAELLWGTQTAQQVRSRIPAPNRLVVRDGATGATGFVGPTATFVPAPKIDVIGAVGAIEAVGPEDAFAAGYLSGVLRGRSQRAALSLGHTLAGRAMALMGGVGHAADGPGIAAMTIDSTAPDAAVATPR